MDAIAPVASGEEDAAIATSTPIDENIVTIDEDAPPLVPDSPATTSQSVASSTFQ